MSAPHLATLYEITRRLNSSLDLDEVLDYVMDRVIEVTGAERGFLMLLNETTGELDYQVARNIQKEDLDNPRFQVSRTVVNQVAQLGEPILTDNAQNRFGKQHSVITMALRSILCVPVAVKERIIGVVYVDNRVHTGVFGAQHLELLTAFASQAGIAIENARLYRIAIEQGRMQRELEMAHTIQRGLLPLEFPILAGYEVAVHWQSAREVAGDFYDCFLLENQQAMGVVIADVSDKGAGAAIFMAITRSLLRGSGMTHELPHQTLHQTNELLLQDATSSGMFVTAYYTVFKPDGEALCSNAGHNLPLLWRANDGSMEWLPRGGRALGWFADLPSETLTYQLEPGDVLVFYTDGLTEAENHHQEQFGEDRLIDVVERTAPHENARGIMDALTAAVSHFIGDAPPFDDITIVVVRYTGA